MMQRDVNEQAVGEALDIPALNNYHGTQDHYDGSSQSIQGDFTRSLKHSQLPGHRDQCSNHRLDIGIPVSAL